MGDTPPSIQEWKNLYDAAIEFKKIGCWNWMWDSDIFGVQNPVSGEIGYCCIVGRLGIHFALAVYLGTEGLEGYLRIQAGETHLTSTDALQLHKCLIASFEDRNSLQKQDLRVIKKLGLKFRGRKEWPLFRNYQPGYQPWYLTREEAKYLTLALQQAVEVSLHFKKDPDMFISPKNKKNHYFVRVPKKEGDNLEWEDKWLEPSPMRKVKIISEPVDENRLKLVEKTATRRQSVWEFDCFYSPSGVGERGERPYYPRIFLWVDHYSGLILGVHMTKPVEGGKGVNKEFLNVIENLKIIPSKILVRKKEYLKLLDPVTSRLDINLTLVEELIAIDIAKYDMIEFLG